MTILYDQFGRKVQVKKRPEHREVAALAVRDKYSTYPSQGLTPERLAAIFKEADGGDIYRQAELFEEMEEKDTHLFSQLQTRKNAVLGLERQIAPASDSAEDKKIAEFCTEVLIDNVANLRDCRLAVLDAIGKAYSMQEVHWATDGRYHVIERLEWIPQKRAVFYELSSQVWQKAMRVPRVLTEAEPIKGEDMPAFKMLYHVYRARSGYDTRAGVLRVCAWMYLFKNYAIKDWVRFMEVFGIPLRLGKYDPGASTDDRDALKTAIQSLGSDAAGIISKATEIEFVEAVKGKTGDNPFSALADFCDKQMSKAVVGQTASSEGTPGKLGAEDAQDNVRHDLLEADATAEDAAWTHQAIRALVGYNFGWDKPLPQMHTQCEEPEDMKEVSAVYLDLRKMGQPMSQEHVSERFKVPLPGKGETPLPPMSNAGGGFDPVAAKFAVNRLVAKAGRGFSPEQEEIEDLVDATTARAEAALNGLTTPVKDLVKGASSLEEIRGKLFSLYPHMDKAALESLTARAMFVADLYGRAAMAKKMKEQRGKAGELVS